MKKKTMLTALVCSALAGAIAMGSTLAYFTDATESKRNVFTVGHVALTLLDEVNGTPGREQWTAESTGEGIRYHNVEPGDTIFKTVGAEVSGKSDDCYVAIKVTLDAKQADLPHAATAKDVKAAVGRVIDAQKTDTWLEDAEDKEWKDDTKIFYCSTKCSEGDRAILFTQLEIPQGDATNFWGNAYSGANFTISVQAAAVQAAHMAAPGSEKVADMGNAQEALHKLLASEDV